MGLLQSVIKFYLAVLIFRAALTRQELYFNQLGKLVGRITDPVLEKTFKLTKKNADNALPLFILAAVLLDMLVIFMLTGYGLPVAFFAGLADIFTFLMLFYIVSVIMGSFAESGLSHYSLFFRRIAAFWVKLTRTFIPIKSNTIVIPAVVIIFAVFTLANAAFSIGLQMVTSGAVNPVGALQTAVRTDIVAVAGLLDIFVWLIIIRALLSWVSPDPRNPVVQLIAALTEPVMEPFRRIIPPLGGSIDISPMILIFVVYFIKMMLIRLVGIIF